MIVRQPFEDCGRKAVFALATLVLEIPESRFRRTAPQHGIEDLRGPPTNLELLQALDWHLRESSVGDFTSQDFAIFVCAVFVRIRRLRKSRQ